ncbi:hypothetical protein G3M48_005829 [Beauveria asiatica]|uniref:BZIP transcription factor n=1 Tax=Beauveria asiatica TaxID=1069075 RepID=A0AAW0RR68_9HYPO
MDTKPSRVKRTLTEEQLDKKRSIDKIKHRENRAENKTRLEAIERDVSFLRHNIGDLVLQLRQLNLVQAPPQHRLSPASSHSGPSTSSQDHLHPFLSLTKPESWNSLPSLGPAPVDAAAAALYTSADDHSITDRLYAQHTFPQRPLEAQMDMEALLAEVRDQGLMIECRCGKPHSADVQCTERIAVVMAVEFSSVSSHDNQRVMTAPRNPTLPEMLLHHTDMSNPLAAIVSSILRQYDITHIDSLCVALLPFGRFHGRRTCYHASDAGANHDIAPQEPRLHPVPRLAQLFVPQPEQGRAALGGPIPAVAAPGAAAGPEPANQDGARVRRTEPGI